MSFVTIISPCFVSHLCVESRFFNYVWFWFGFFRLMYPILCTLYYVPYIAHFWFSNVYWPVFLDCPFWLPFRYLLTFICQFLSIVHFWLPLWYSLTFICQFLWIVNFVWPLRYSITFILPVSLDCPFLMAPFGIL